MENKIPTAEEFALSDNWEKVIDHVTIKRMKDFAKLHVKAALKAASKSESNGTEGYKIYPESILNSYPNSNIK
jgi:hypothetical protein